ncbi:MAG: hypothetical protein KKE44_25805 [Proteobacteria bacterium]|nr:hypothetical protein [Pseudomonadota bacterium]MBU1586148.1 hypothetical protein [Pseudomonadota bacterium]MBU2455670.1 hypothetical protein [Pseudomonadota bacterium]MBU2627624.1 hypothetical protein [Pseudomonadota bacterium]
MEPDKFRESRQEINRMFKNINALIDQNELEASKSCYQEVYSKLDKLKPQAEGEIQERSVKNLGIRINSLLNFIGKLKPPKKTANKDGKTTPKTVIVWDEDLVAKLSPGFLKKVLTNMGEDTDARVCFGTTGKGIRPGYQVEFSNQEKTTFSGSGHSPVKKPLSANSKQISQPFSHGLIDSILRGK